MTTRDASGAWAGPEFGPNATMSSTERGLCLSAIFGAVSGAFAGSALAAGTADVFPAVFGMLGTVGGSALAAAAWSALAGRPNRHS
jgi:outer membrane lipoprotein SlyB